MIRTVHHNRPITRRAETPHPVTPRRAARRNNRGLTTLEWLLIVAAVAGLAALAVVLVQNVVDETAEQISGSSARLTAALVAAQEISDNCKDKTDASKTVSCTSTGTNGASDVSRTDAKSKCDRLRITYGDAFDGSSPKKEALWFIAAVPTSTNPEKYDNEPLDIKAHSCRIVDVYVGTRPTGRV